MKMWNKQVIFFLSFQESKKFFKRADLVQKEREDYFKRCGYKVHAHITHHSLSHKHTYITTFPLYSHIKLFSLSFKNKLE